MPEVIKNYKGEQIEIYRMDELRGIDYIRNADGRLISVRIGLPEKWIEINPAVTGNKRLKKKILEGICKVTDMDKDELNNFIEKKLGFERVEFMYFMVAHIKQCDEERRN